MEAYILSPIAWLAFICAASVGGVVRWLLSSRFDATVPWGTLGANTLGCVIMAVVVSRYVQAHDPLAVVFGAGMCGSLTTWSSLANGVRGLWNHSPLLALGYFALSLGLSGTAFTATCVLVMF